MALSFQDKIRPVATSTKPLSFQDKIRPVEKKPVNRSVMPTVAPVQTQKNWASNIPVLKQVQDFGLGVGSAIGNAGLGLGQAALKVGMGVGNVMNKVAPGSVDNSLAQGAYDTLEKGKQAIFNKPFEGNLQTASGKTGQFVGNIAPYFSGGAPTQASKLSLGTIFPRVKAALPYAVPDMVVAAGQSSGDLKTTLTTGLTSAVTGGLIPTAKAPIRQKIASGAASGYVADVAQGMAGMRGEDRMGGAAFIPGLGTAVGTAGGIISAIPQVRQSTKTYVTDRSSNKNYKVLDTLQKSNKPLDRKIIAADKSGIDTKRVLAESNLLAGAVDTNGTVNSKVAVENLNEVLRPWEAKVGDALATENKRIPVADLKTKLLATINDSGLVGTMKQQAQARAIGELEALASEADEAGTIPLKLVHDLKVQTNRNNAKSFIDPEKNAIGKTVGRGLKEFVETSTDAIDVKTYNEELRKFYALRNVLEALDGKKVNGGRLGKYVAQTIGGIAGSALGGPLGAVAGAEIGGAIKGASMSRALGGIGGKQVQPTQRMIDASYQVPRYTPTAIADSTAIPKPIPSVADGSLVSRTNNATNPITASTKPTANVQIIPPTANRTGFPSQEKKVPATNNTQNQPTRSVATSIPPVIPQSKNPSSVVMPSARNTAQQSQMFAGGVAGFEVDDNGHVTFNPEKALMGMAGMVGAQRLSKTQIVQRLRTSLPAATKMEMADFIATVKGGGVKTTKNGTLQFATKADEEAFDAGLRLVNDKPMLRKYANDTLAKIANLYDEVLDSRSLMPR